jgi:hypothetical protein
MSASENPRSKALQKKTLMTSSYDGVSDANDEDSRVRDERVLRKVWRVEPQGDRTAYEKVYVRHDEVYQMGERDKDRERRRGGGGWSVDVCTEQNLTVRISRINVLLEESM